MNARRSPKLRTALTSSDTDRAPYYALVRVRVDRRRDRVRAGAARRSRAPPPRVAGANAVPDTRRGGGGAPRPAPDSRRGPEPLVRRGSRVVPSIRRRPDRVGRPAG